MILLGFLRTPASGYDLKKSFDESVRHFWNARLSQIYPTLYGLHEKGLVTVSTRPSDRGPDRKVYTRTRSGTEELERWLVAGPVVEDQRIEYLAQLFFLGQVRDTERTKDFIVRLRETFGRRLEAFRAIQEHHRSEDREHPADLAPETVQPYLTLLFGIRRVEATLDWCDECLELLGSIEDEEARRRA